jgi:hypothetical protein
MKLIFVLLFTVSLSQLAVSQTTAPIVSPNSTTQPVDVVLMKEMEHDFGKIPQGKPVTTEFYFTNTGKTPLVLDNVQASCGCTTPEWSKEPVAAGATSRITVGYNAASEGAFTKMITIQYNGSQVKQLYIKGEVWKTPVSPAPANKALGSLKN